MAAGPFSGIHHSHTRLSCQALLPVKPSNTFPEETPLVSAKKVIECVDIENPLYLSRMPVGPDTQFELREPERIARLVTLKSQEITLVPNPKVLESHKIPFPILKFNLAKLSAYLGLRLGSLFRHEVSVWLVGRAARNVITAVDFNDFDLVVYCENPFFNDNCPIIKKKHFVFRRIQEIMIDFLIQELNKTESYHTFKDLLPIDYLIRACYLTNRKIFDDGTGCLYSLGGKIDIKVLFTLDKPKSVADADGIHIRLNSEIPILQCANGKFWCGNVAARSLALHRAECRLFYVQDADSIRDLIFRLILESRQGFALELDNVESGFKKMEIDYPTQELFTASFCRHQVNHCKDQMSRIIDFLTWITYAENRANHIQMIASAWLDGSRKLELSDDIEIPMAIFLKKHPEMAETFLSFLRGLLLLKLADNKDPSFKAYDFPFMERQNKPREQFAFFYANKYHYLFIRKTPIQIASDFLTYYSKFIVFMKGNGGISQLNGLLNFLGIDVTFLDRVKTSAQIAGELLKAFTKKPVDTILQIQYEGALPLRSFYALLRTQMRGEDLESLKIQIAKTELEACVLKNKEKYPQLGNFVRFILGKEKDPIDCLRAPILLSEIFWNPEYAFDAATDFILRESITNLLPGLMDEAYNNPSMAKLQSFYAIYEMLDRKDSFSPIVKSHLLLVMLKTFNRITFPITQNAGWMDQLCREALECSFLQQSEMGPELIESYLFALERLTKSKDESVLLSNFYYLEKALIWKDSHRDRLLSILAALISNSSLKRSIIISRQICIAFDHISRNHKMLFNSLILKSGLIENVIQAAEELIPDLSKESMYESVIYRIMHTITGSSTVLSPSLLNLFSHCLMNPSVSFESREVLGEIAINLLDRKPRLDKSYQGKLCELAFNLIGTFRKNREEVMNAQRLGYKLIEGISRCWPEHDAEFHTSRQELLERIAHCLLKREKYIEKVKYRLPAYIKAYIVLSRLEGKIVEQLNSIALIDLLTFKSKACSEFIKIVEEQDKSLLTVEVFVKLNGLSKIERDDSKRSSRIPSAAAAPAVERPAQEKLSFDQKLAKNIERTISCIRNFDQDRIIQRAFKVVYDPLMEFNTKFVEMLDSSQIEKIKSGLQQLFKTFLGSRQISSPINAYRLFHQMRILGFLSEKEVKEASLVLIDTFMRRPVKDSLNYLEILLGQFFEIKDSFKDLKVEFLYLLLNSYALVLEKSGSPNLEKMQIILQNLLQEESIRIHRVGSNKLAILGYTLIRRCLETNSENHFAIAISTLHQLIDTQLIDDMHLQTEFETVALLLVSAFPKSWKTGRNTELKSLLQSIRERNILSRLSTINRFHLIQLLRQTNNHILVEWANNLVVRSMKGTTPRHSDVRYCLTLLKKGIEKCGKEDNLLAIQESSTMIQQNWNLIESVLAGDKWRTRLNNGTIYIFTKTEDVYYQTQACQIFMKGPVSPESFLQLLIGFIKLPIHNYTRALQMQFMDVVQHYAKHYLPLQKNQAELSRCHELILEFLTKFGKLSGKSNETIEILSLLFNSFPFANDPVSLKSINAILTHIKEDLVQFRKLKELSHLCSFVINHLKEDSKSKFLTSLIPFLFDAAAVQNSLGKRVGALVKPPKAAKETKQLSFTFSMGDAGPEKEKNIKYSKANPEQLIELLPIYCQFDPTMMQQFIHAYVADVINQKIGCIRVAKLIMEGYKFGLFRKYTITPWTTQDITNLTAKEKEVWDKRLSEINEKILGFLSREGSSEALNLFIEYFTVMLEHSGETTEEVIEIFQYDILVSRFLLRHFLSNTESPYLINYVTNVVEIILKKQWHKDQIMQYFTNLKNLIFKMMSYPFLLKQLKTVALAAQRTVRRTPFSYDQMKTALQKSSVLDAWSVQIHKHSFVEQFQNHFIKIEKSKSSYFELNVVIEECLKRFTSEQFEYAISDGACTSFIPRIIELITNYTAKTMSFETRILEDLISETLQRDRLTLVEMISTFILLTSSSEFTVLAYSKVESLVDVMRQHNASIKELIKYKTSGVDIASLFKEAGRMA